MSDPADLDVVEAASLLAGASCPRGELAAPASPGSASATGRRATTATPARSTPGCASTRRMRWQRPRSPMRGWRVAVARRPAPALRDPARAEGPLRRRRQAAHRIEPAAPRARRPPTATSGPGSRRGHGAARPPAHARVRRRRHDRPGREPVGSRPLGGRLERWLGGGARGAHGARRDGHGHGRLAAHPLGALRHVDDQADARARVARGGRPLAPSLDHAGPMARSSRRLRGAARRLDGEVPLGAPSSLAGARLAVSPGARRA